MLLRFQCPPTARWVGLTELSRGNKFLSFNYQQRGFGYALLAKYADSPLAVWRLARYKVSLRNKTLKQMRPCTIAAFIHIIKIKEAAFVQGHYRIMPFRYQCQPTARWVGLTELSRGIKILGFPIIKYEGLGMPHLPSLPTFRLRYGGLGE